MPVGLHDRSLLRVHPSTKTIGQSLNGGRDMWHCMRLDALCAKKLVLQVNGQAGSKVTHIAISMHECQYRQAYGIPRFYFVAELCPWTWAIHRSHDGSPCHTAALSSHIGWRENWMSLHSSAGSAQGTVHGVKMLGRTDEPDSCRNTHLELLRSLTCTKGSTASEGSCSYHQVYRARSKSDS